MLVLISILAFLAVTSAEMVRMEPSVDKFSSSNWILESSIDETKVIKAIFVLKHEESALQSFEKNLLDISSPKSKNYGKWMSSSDIIRWLAPSDDKVKTVVDYIESFGVKSENVVVSMYKDLITVDMPVSVANKMLNTKFAVFRSISDRQVALPRISEPYALPSEIANLVSVVDNIMRFPTIRHSKKSYGSESTATDPFATCGTKCNGYTTPEVLVEAYNITVAATATSGNSVSVAEFQYQYYDNTDINNFASACGVKVAIADTIGGNNPNVCNVGCVEALLDIEYIGAIVYPIPLTVIYSATYSLFNWVDQIIALPNPPLVHSVSYGNDEVQQTSTAYMQSCDVEFQKAAALGLSILFASGDQGVWGRTGVGAKYNPDFPAGSPYITAVGGTNFKTKSVIGEESTWSCGGGGFSDTFPIPAFQTNVVADYLATASAAGVLPKASLFNANGRAYPDISALGGQTNPYCVAYSAGSFGGVAGTSASCPVVAGVFAQLNNVRLKAGKTSLGWLNPFIYQVGVDHPECFNDVKDGSSNYCNAGTVGFQALKGWDPATGFGTPNFGCLAQYALEY